MIKNGTRPAKHLYKERKFHHLFGGIAPAQIPDFNLDTGINGMPDQDREQAPTECTGYAPTDILSDIFKVAMDPDFAYAAGLYVAGIAPNENGGDFHASMQAAVVVGALAKSLANISASVNGELYCSDWGNWMDDLKNAARKNVENGILNVLGNGTPFDSILSSLYTGQISVSIGTPWFPEWSYGIENGVVQVPQITGNYPTWHNWAIKGKKTINGLPYLIGKTWQGDRVGDNGLLYFSPDAINAALSVQGTGALTFNPAANRWASFIGILVQRFPQLLPDLGKLLTSYA